MSVIPSGIDLSSTNVPPEIVKKTEPESNAPLVKDINGIQEQKNIAKREAIEKASEQPSTQQPLTPEQLEKVAQQLQDFVGDMNRGLEFSVDKDSGRDVIKVIDKSSGDLVKQFPSEEVLSLVAKLSDMVGSFVDAKV